MLHEGDSQGRAGQQDQWTRDRLTVQGAVRFANEQLDDMVLLRSDGTPTYMLSVVVDDHDMAITHIIRGDDHLVNAARQTQLYLALDWPLPTFARRSESPTATWRSSSRTSPKC